MTGISRLMASTHLQPLALLRRATLYKKAVPATVCLTRQYSFTYTTQTRRQTSPTRTTTSTSIPFHTQLLHPRHSSTMAPGQPSGPIADKGIELFTAGTPNGYKASIILEELKEAYGLTYTTQALNIGTNVQKEPWFTAINPNGRIPALLDHDNGDLPIFEGNAILGYLTRRYDPDNKFSFPVDSNEYTIAESWIGWQHGGVGPMQGQAGHFLRFAKEEIPWAIQRYVGETERLYGILDAHLAKPENKGYVAGGRYSIADISLIGWANNAEGATLDLEGQFPHVLAWIHRLWERPAVQKGFAVPNLPFFGSVTTGYSDEAKAKNEQVKKTVQAAKEKYGYVYTSP